MRVLLVTPSYFPIVGGSEILTQILSTRLNEKGFHSDIMTFNMVKKWNTIWRNELTENGSARVFKEAALNPLPRISNPLSITLRANVLPEPGFIRKYNHYDIIHFIGEADLSFPLFSYFVKKPKLLQCVGIYRRGGLYKYYTHDRVVIGKVFKKIFPRLADLFVVAGSEEKQLLLDLAVPERKIDVLPIGVDTEIFQLDQSSETTNIILFVGRIDRIKGLHILLRALQYIEIPLKIVVIGPRWDEKYFEEIENMSRVINRVGVHSVTLMGEMDPKDLATWYQKATALVCPYIYETHSNVVREALACGTPVISTGSHLAEGCSDGILITSLNPKELAKVINSLLENPNLCKKLGRDGRNIIEQYFSWDSVIEKLTEIYDKMLNSYVLL